jgi:hypothetical protein
LEPEVGLDDMRDAYRTVPVHIDDEDSSIVAFWHPIQKEWCFVDAFANGYGLELAVHNFCRFPTLSVAAARRIFATPSGAFFDDNLVIDIAASR